MKGRMIEMISGSNMLSKSPSLASKKMSFSSTVCFVTSQSAGLFPFVPTYFGKLKPIVCSGALNLVSRSEPSFLSHMYDESPRLDVCTVSPSSAAITHVDDPICLVFSTASINTLCKSVRLRSNSAAQFLASCFENSPGSTP